MSRLVRIGGILKIQRDFAIEGSQRSGSVCSAYLESRTARRAVASRRLDRDGWPDVVVANDALPQQFFRNNHNGTFTEVALDRGLAHDDDARTFSGMGVSFEDYDNDGWPDIFIDALR